MPTGVYKRSDEHKNKLSLKLKGKKRGSFTIEHKEKLRQAKIGKKLSEDHKRKIRESGRGSHSLTDKQRKEISYRMKGIKNHQWRGGTSTVRHRIRVCPKYKEWRLKVFYRDGFECLHCGGNKNIEADHIIPFSFVLQKMIFEKGIENMYENAQEYKLLWDTGNGRTLCKECHKKTDSFGIKAKKYKV